MYVDILHFISGLSTDQGASPINFSDSTGPGVPIAASMGNSSASVKSFFDRLFDTREAIHNEVKQIRDVTTIKSQICVQTHMLGQGRTQAHHEAINWAAVKLGDIQESQKIALEKAFAHASPLDGISYKVQDYTNHSVEEKTPKPRHENAVKAEAVLRVLSKKMSQKISFFKEFYSNEEKKQREEVARCRVILKTFDSKTTEHEQALKQLAAAQQKFTEKDQQPLQAYMKIKEQIETIKENEVQLADVYNYIIHSSGQDTQDLSKHLACLGRHYSPFRPKSESSFTLLQYLKNELADSYSYIFDESRVVAAWVSAKLQEYQQTADDASNKYILYVAYPEKLEACITCPANQTFEKFLEDNPSLKGKVELEFTATNEHVKLHQQLLTDYSARKLPRTIYQGGSSSDSDTSQPPSPPGSPPGSPQRRNKARSPSEQAVGSPPPNWRTPKRTRIKPTTSSDLLKIKEKVSVHNMPKALELQATPISTDDISVTL